MVGQLGGEHSQPELHQICATRVARGGANPSDTRAGDWGGGVRVRGGADTHSSGGQVRGVRD